MIYTQEQRPGPTRGREVEIKMDFWRRSVRISTFANIINNEIRRILEVEDAVAEVFEKRRLKWFGHLSRMNDTRIPKMVHEWILGGRGRRHRE